MKSLRFIVFIICTSLLIISCGTDEESGSGAVTEKTVKFRNAGTDNVLVRVYQCTLEDSSLACPDISVAIFVGSVTDPGMQLPLGQYSFCIEWDLGSGKPVYVNQGWLPGYPALSLDENTSDSIPPIIYVSSTSLYFTGSCPAPVSVP